MPSTPTLHRDTTYYEEDGNVVLRAGDVLFKTHRSRLSKSSALFKDMFTLPGPRHFHQDGLSDERPIVLKDDPAEVQALFWALNLLPHEVTTLLQQSASEDVCLKLLRVGQIAHKYQFEHIDRWALETVFNFLMKIPFVFDYELISKLIRTTRLCAPEELETAEALVRNALDKNKAELSVVLSAAESLGLTMLAGQAYQRTLLDRNSNWLTDPALSLKIRTNLLYGYQAFSELWFDASRAPPPISHHQCLHLGPCLWMWQEIWREAVVAPDITQLAPYDFVGKLRAVKACSPFLKERSGQWPDKGGVLAFVCRPGAVVALDQRIAEVEGKLIEFFRMPAVERSAAAEQNAGAVVSRMGDISL